MPCLPFRPFFRSFLKCVRRKRDVAEKSRSRGETSEVETSSCRRTYAKPSPKTASKICSRRFQLLRKLTHSPGQKEPAEQEVALEQVVTVDLHELAERELHEPMDLQDPAEEATQLFSHYTLLGDSHVQNMGHFLAEQLDNSVTIDELCLFDSGLLQVSRAVPVKPPPEHCLIIMAGSYDVLNGRSDVIFIHLEQFVQKWKETSRIVLLSLFPRHDRSPGDHPDHAVVSLINTYMDDLAARNEGVELVDTSILGRDQFNVHGLHLRPSGKRSLTKLIMQSVRRMQPIVDVQLMPLEGSERQVTDEQGELITG